MFIGEYHHSVDAKGRLAVPAKFRGDLEGGAVITKSVDNCLSIYTLEEWKKTAESIAKLPFNQANARAYSRQILAGAMDVQVDSQGRIIIPEYLREYAGISKKVVVAGLYTRLEIWDADQWQTYKAQTEYESETIAEALGDLSV